MINDLIQRIFASRNAAHLAHWKTKSYSEHMALCAFYNGLIEDIDAVVEAHQGVFDLVDLDSLPAMDLPSNLIKHLEDDLVWINRHRKAITGGLPAIDNLVQALESTYMTTLYKLKHLT